MTEKSPKAERRIIEFRPCAGFANRLRAMVSALCAAEDIGWKVRIWWPIERGICSVPFSALFQYPIFNAQLLSIEERWHNYPELLVKDDAEWSIVAKRIQAAPTSQLIYLKSYYQFHKTDMPRWLGRLQSLLPREEHMKRVNECLAPAKGKVLIGIHIRRTDNQISILHSPSEGFWKAMDHILISYPDAYFFIASDDDRERDMMRAKYGERRILTLAKTLDRTSAQGGVDAFLDFLALSECREIWGSVHSSFCELAAQYGGIPYVQIGVPEAK
jgi:hypothetical protein